jgi:Polynucleotide kinase 3 phosphatase
MEDTILQTKKSRRTKFAIFDFDWTLVKPKAGRKFPTKADDWMYLRPSVPDVVRKAVKALEDRPDSGRNGGYRC